MTDTSKEKIYGSGYYAVKEKNGYAVTFDPGAHLPQDVTVMLTDEEFERIQGNETEFDEVIVPAMVAQNIIVR